MKSIPIIPTNCCVQSAYCDSSRAAIIAERSAMLRWGGFVILLLGGSVGAWIYAAFLAISDPSMAVVPDYHEKALHWDEHLATERASHNTGWTTAIVPGPIVPGPLATSRTERELTIFVRDRDAKPVTGATGQLRYYHHARAGAAQTATLRESDPGSYVCQAPFVRAGFWQIELKLERGDVRFESSTAFELSSP